MPCARANHAPASSCWEAAVPLVVVFHDSPKALSVHRKLSQKIVSVSKHDVARRRVLPTPCCPTTNYYCMMNLTLMPPSALLSRARGSWSLKKTAPPCAPCKTTSTTAWLASVSTCSQVPSLIPRTAAVFCWWNSCRARECARKWR
jgi:hypothetical protein